MDTVQLALKERYSHLHPLIFLRSLDKARTNGELFDILESVPKELPVLWDEDLRAWRVTHDLLQSNQEDL